MRRQPAPPPPPAHNDPHTDPDNDPDDQPDAYIAGQHADTIRIAILPTASTASSATIGDLHRRDHHPRGRPVGHSPMRAAGSTTSTTTTGTTTAGGNSVITACDYDNWSLVSDIPNHSDLSVQTYPNVHRDYDDAPLSHITSARLRGHRPALHRVHLEHRLRHLDRRRVSPTS